MSQQPAALDGEIEPGSVLGRTAAFLEQEGPVELFDMDAAILHGLGRVGDLQELARGGFKIGIETAAGELRAISPVA